MLGAPSAGPGGAARPPGTRTVSPFARGRLGTGLDFRADEVPAAEEARQRHGALLALLEVGRELEEADPAASVDDFLTEVERRTALEADGAAGAGVELLTYHRAKGLEWDAVFLPALEEGLLPIRQASEPAEIDEERRLLYVGITRARVHLWLSSARHRDGRATERRRSRFLLELLPPVVRPAPRPRPARPEQARPGGLGGVGRPQWAPGGGRRRAGMGPASSAGAVEPR